jgi:xanthine dehydrogenase accessory factor
MNILLYSTQESGECMEDILPILLKLPFLKESSVLATIIHVEGSSYKKEGSCMLIEENGEQIGILSAGCLEEDVKCHVKQVWKQGESKLLIYDLRGESDIIWGQGAGCNGIMHILLEPLKEPLRNDLMQVKYYLDKGQSVFHLKRFDKDFKLLSNSYIPQDGAAFGDLSYLTDLPVFPNKSGLFYTEDLLPIFSHHYMPRPRVIVFGAGFDARPLENFAAQVGFEVIICDWRPHYCNKVNFPFASSLIVCFPREIDEKLDIKNGDFVVLMTHDFQKDKELLSILIDKNLSYLGILGPKERTKRLLDHNDIPNWISSPVGISIGSKGAEEIAISIVAEMIKALRNPRRFNE